jgi:hypothetical protein
MIYLTGENSLVVNLYTTSDAIVEVGGGDIHIKQKTDYPTSGKIRIELATGTDRSFDLMLRIPSWCKHAMVSVNGEMRDASASSGQFFILSRTWSDADEVEIFFEMQPRIIKGTKRQSGRIAVMRGPQLYCLNPVNSGKLKNLDGASLGQITLYPKSLELLKDDSVRPNGTALKVEVWPPGDYRTLPDNLSEIILTEFADPGGVATYFQLQDLDEETVEDELFRQNRTLLPGFMD